MVSHHYCLPQPSNVYLYCQYGWEHLMSASSPVDITTCLLIAAVIIFNTVTSTKICYCLLVYIYYTRMPYNAIWRTRQAYHLNLGSRLLQQKLDAACMRVAYLLIDFSAHCIHNGRTVPNETFTWPQR
jgi:hypothetical protein